MAKSVDDFEIEDEFDPELLLRETLSEPVNADTDKLDFEDDNIVVVKKANSRLQQAFKQTENVFDPRILGEKQEIRQNWSSKSVELANNGLSQGYKLKESPYLKYVKDVNLRKARLAFSYTEDEKWTISTCFNDINFFGNNFISLKQEDIGWERITLRDYQSETLSLYDKHRWNILMFPRQSGKTTTTIVKIVHFCTFNVDKDCVVIAQSDLVVSEILKKIKEAFSSLPFFMQPGFVSFTKDGFVLDNGCRLKIGIASESVVQGFSLDFLFIDEFAYIPESRVNRFWNNIYPSLVNNPNSRCVIASTPNGRNKFYELWNNSILKINSFHNKRIYWYDVPGRDEKFKQETISNVGLEAWEMGFECSFDTQLKSIFTVKWQKNLRKNQEDFKDYWSKDNDIIYSTIDDLEFIDKNKIDYNLKTDYFVITVDIAEGLELDSSVIKIRKTDWDITNKRLLFKTIGVYRSNKVSVQDLSIILMELISEMDNSKIKVIVENNQFGGELFAYINNLIETDSKYFNFDKYVFAKFFRNQKEDFEYGIRYNASNKKIAVRSFKKLIETEVIQEFHYLSIEEYLNFGRLKNDTYAAQYGNDDLVMVDVTLSAFLDSNTIYSNEFLTECENNLRIVYNDLSKIQIESIELKQKQTDSQIIIDGWNLRTYNREFGNVNNKVVKQARRNIELNKRNKQNNYDDYFGEKLDRNKNPINKRKLF